QFFPKKGPLIDLYETADGGIILVELPGLPAIHDIKMKQSGMNLILIGNIPSFVPEGNVKNSINERFTGPFERRIPIPFAFSAQDVTARYENGLLEIKLRKMMNENPIDVRFE